MDDDLHSQMEVHNLFVVLLHLSLQCHFVSWEEREENGLSTHTLNALFHLFPPSRSNLFPKRTRRDSYPSTLTVICEREEGKEEGGGGAV